ncbi:MAG: replicative DNA helicase, partial [Cyanobacteria bacterium NC_groundwater_1444_Ag_S-0.65um_54_12]|nr:replicative DNA helicase [Cyanobacteria bacterium NC_groundwater_1444_Ag_S-0.65um_54_12]
MSVDVLGRIPPQNQEAEQNILGALLLGTPDVAVKIFEILGMNDCFYRQSHQTIFDAMRDLHENGEPIDLVSVANHMQSTGKLEEVGGRLHLADLCNSVATAAHAEYYAKIIAEKALLRALIRAGTEVTALGYSEDQEVELVLDQAEQKVFEVAQRRITQDVMHIETVLHDAFAKIEQRFEMRGTFTGTASGFYDIDALTAGFQPSNLIIVGARPSMGKTAFALCVARNAAAGPYPGQAGKPVIVFSLEMSREELVMRLLCAEARVDGSRVRTGQVAEEDWWRLGQAVGRLAEWPIYIDDTPAITVTEIRGKCRRLAAELGKEIGLI